MKRGRSVIMGGTAGLFLSFAAAAPAAMVSWNLDTVYEGPTPDGSAPWATITLEESSDPDCDLELTIESKLVAGSGNFFDKIGLSYSGAGSITVSEDSRSGIFTVTSINDGIATFPGGEKLNFVFDTAQSAANRFDATDWIVYCITGAQLSDFTSVLAGNDYLVTAHLGGLGPDNQGSSGLTDGGGPEEIPVPEPSTYIAGALLLLPLASALMRKRFVRKNA